MATIPLPQMASHVAWLAAACCLVGGAVLLLLGDRLHRVALALAGAGAGLLVGRLIAQKLSFSVSVGAPVGAVVGALLGLIVARLVWSLLAMLLGLTASAWVFAGEHFQAPSSAPETPLAWLGASARGLWAAVKESWGDQPKMLMIVLAICGGVPLLAAIFRPRLARLLLTAMIGATAVVGGAIFAAAQVSPGVWSGALSYGGILAAVMVVLMLGGLTLQYRRILAAGPTDEDIEAEPVEMRKADQAKRKAKERSE